MLKEKIGKSLGLDPDYIDIIAKRNDLYAKYYIDKKGGGKREILQPSKELKVIQRWILRNLLYKFPISKYSCAYSKGNSVKKNALIHCDSNYIFHTDVTNFFPSITRKILNEYFFEHGKEVNELQLSKDDIKLILDICLYRGEYLVVGSVASPTIANMVMYDFDNKLAERLLKEGRFKYSRYADDITISSMQFIDKRIIEIVKEEMAQKGFVINHRKTYFTNKKHKRQITGVVIDNNRNKLSVGNKKYKEIQRKLYHYLIKGEGEIEYIIGYLSYLKDLNREQYLQLEKIYKKYDKNQKIFM